MAFDVKIYTLSDPRTDIVCYVGKSKNLTRRYISHVKDKGDTHKARWVRSLLALDLMPLLNVVETVNESEWEIAERRWIAYYRRINSNLTNHTDGGEGAHNPDESSRQKLSETRKKMFQDAAFRERMLSSARDGDRREKISRALSGRKKSPEHIAKLSQNHPGWHHSDEAKKKIRENRRGNQWTPEQIAELRTCNLGNKYGVGNKSRSGQKRGVDELRKVSEKLKGRAKSPEHREKLRIAALKRWAGYREG